MSCHLRFLCVLFSAGSLLSVPVLADSHARVVRLSEVQGEVLVDRQDGKGFEKAFMNLPLHQDLAIRTGKGGRATLEFEDRSTLRLTPETTIQLSQLSLSDSGTKTSTVHLDSGLVYLNFLGSKDEKVDLKFD